MNKALADSFFSIVSGLAKYQFNLEVRKERFKDELISCMIQFFFLLLAAFILGDGVIAMLLVAGFAFTSLTLFIHLKTGTKRIDLKTGSFYFVYMGFFLPIIFYYCGRYSIGIVFLLIQSYFSLFFILNILSALLLGFFGTGAWFIVFKYYDKFSALGMSTANSHNLDMVFAIGGFFIAVLTIGSLIHKTINAYDKEQNEAKRLLNDYNKKLYMSGSKNIYNDRYLLSSVATRGVLTENGDIPGFTAVVFSVDNIELIEKLSKKENAETFEVFSRKVKSVIFEDEIFVRQKKNYFALILNTVDVLEAEEKIDELIASINMTIFEHLPKDRLSISVGYSIHTAGLSTAHTMQDAADNMLVARRKGGNCKVGGND